MDTNNVGSDEETERVKDELYEVQQVINEMNESRAIDEEFIDETTQRRKEKDNKYDAKDTFPRGTPQGDTLWAAESGNLEKISELLDEDPTLVAIQDTDGYTPLHRACYSNNIHIVKFLLERGADVNARTSDGWTPLHSACKWNNHECASVLLDFGADLNLVTNGGQTPLHLASSHPESKQTLLLLLLNPKININIRNSTGELASDIAHRHCKYYKLFSLHDECLNLI